jgi:hypothetical protein
MKTNTKSATAPAATTAGTATESSQPVQDVDGKQFVAVRFVGTEDYWFAELNEVGEQEPPVWTPQFAQEPELIWPAVGSIQKEAKRVGYDTHPFTTAWN